MTMATLHPLIATSLMNVWYFAVLLSRAYVANLSLQYVNLINYMMRFGVGFFGSGCLYGWPMTQSELGLNLALRWHLWVQQVHGNSDVGAMFYWDGML